jgi:hypothetical protein
MCLLHGKPLLLHGKPLLLHVLLDHFAPALAHCPSATKRACWDEKG